MYGVTIMFSRRHYNAIADVLAKTAAERRLEPVSLLQDEAMLLQLVRDFDVMFSQDSDTYDSDRFYNAVYKWSTEK
jgi:hypothetical protein